MVPASCGNAVLIPALSLAGGIAKTIQYRSNLVITIANRHLPDNLQSFHGRRRFCRRTRALDHELGVGAAFPMNRELEGRLLRVRVRWTPKVGQNLAVF